MVIFLDTSAWIKFFLQKAGTEEIKNFLLEQSQIAENTRAASAVTLAEMIATLKRAVQGHRIKKEEYAPTLSGFKQQWEDMDIPHVDDHHIQQAGHLAETHTLKGCDAFQLASAQAIQANVFICSDRELYNAAKTERFIVWNPVNGEYSKSKEEPPRKPSK